MALAVVNFFKLPKDAERGPFSLRRLGREIDWVGVLLSSSCLGIISYVFAYVSLSSLTLEILIYLILTLIL